MQEQLSTQTALPCSIWKQNIAGMNQKWQFMFVLRTEVHMLLLCPWLGQRQRHAIQTDYYFISFADSLIQVSFGTSHIFFRLRITTSRLSKNTSSIHNFCPLQTISASYQSQFKVLSRWSQHFSSLHCNSFSRTSASQCGELRHYSLIKNPWIPCPQPKQRCTARWSVCVCVCLCAIACVEIKLAFQVLLLHVSFD